MLLQCNNHPVKSPRANAEEPSQILVPPDGRGGIPPYAFVAGDLDRDGYADVVAGAIGDDMKPATWIYPGGPDGLAEEPSQQLPVPEGAEVMMFAPAGDVNGDGFADLVARGGAAYGPPMRVFVYLGRAGGLDEAPDQVIEAPGEDALVLSLAGALDADADGYADVFVALEETAAPPPDNPDALPAPRASTCVLTGGPDGLSTSLDASCLDVGATYNLLLSRVGDVDGDGRSEVVLRTEGETRTALVLGSDAGLLPASHRALAPPTAEPEMLQSFAAFTAGLGDVDRDGYADLFVFGEGPSSSSEPGESFVYHGSAEGIGEAPSAIIHSPMPYLEY